MGFTIISRNAWGARHDRGFRAAPLPADEVWLHHSVTIAPDLGWLDADRDGVDDDEERAMRTLEDIGESRFGGGISYTWLIPPSGRIYDGHGVDRQGAHTGGRNDRARAICFIGNYETHRPTVMQIRAAAWLLQHAHARGWIRRARLDGGHRDLKATACPGRHAYALIDDINQLAAGGLTEEDDLREDERLWLYRLYLALVTGEYRETYKKWPQINLDLGAVRGDIGSVSRQVAAVQGAISSSEARVLAALPTATGGAVDVPGLADALALELGPDLGEALLDALAAQLNRNREGN